MTPQQEARQAALGVLRSLGHEVKGIIREEIDWRRQHPCATARYFEVMAEKGGALLRPWRRFQARRFQAKCVANGDSHTCGRDKP